MPRQLDSDVPNPPREHPLENLDVFLSSYGYWVFFAVGFAEFVGVPIVSVPVLLGGGALVASGTLGFWGVVVSVFRRWLARRPGMVHGRPSTRLLADLRGLRTLVQPHGLCLVGKESAFSRRHFIPLDRKNTPGIGESHRRCGGSSRLRETSLPRRRRGRSHPMGGDLHGDRLDLF